jgi:hypothetical protein
MVNRFCFSKRGKAGGVAAGITRAGSVWLVIICA